MSTSDKMRTLAEMTAEETFIQHLELLRSGSEGGLGINRALAQLARNTDALLDALTASRSVVLVGSATISWTSPTLDWSAGLTLRFANEVGGSNNNTIAIGSVAMSSVGYVAYVVLDRTTSGAAVTVSTVATMAAFAALITDNVDRLDYQIIAYRDNGGIILMDGRRIISGQALTASGFTDSQYGQQAELTTVHDNQKEDRQIILMGGGVFHWDATAISGTEGELTWTDDFLIKFPITGGYNRINTALNGSFEFHIGLEDGDVAYVTLVRGASGIADDVAATVAVPGDVALDDDDVFVFIARNGDKVYLWNGTSLSDGESVELGSAQSGLQWYYRELGTAAQITSFTSIKEYEVGDHSLMVYKNGVKARGSEAYWDGIHPSGSLSGALDIDDEYVEEDRGEGRGYRILWLADDDDPLGHPAASHAPDYAWPTNADWVEAFVGLHGEGSSPVDSVGIEGEGTTLDGDVVLRGDTGVSLSYDGNVLVIGLDAAAGVSSLEALDNSGPITGAVKLSGGFGVALVDDADLDGGVITFSLNTDDFQGDQAGVEIVDADNPPVGRLFVTEAIPTLYGFSQGGSTESGEYFLIMSGSVLIGNRVYRTEGNTQFPLPDSVLDADTLTPSAWHYLYVGVDVDSNVVGYVSTTPPSVTWSLSTPITGYHPDDEIDEGQIRFVGSVYVNSSSEFHPISRSGTEVILGEPIDMATFGLALTGLITSTQTLTITDALPATVGFKIGLRLELHAAGLHVDDYVKIGYRAGGTAFKYLYAAMPAGSHATFDLDIAFPYHGAGTRTVDIVLSNGGQVAVDGFWLTSYSEDPNGLGNM
jgi:hypothetical protein